MQIAVYLLFTVSRLQIAEDYRLKIADCSLHLHLDLDLNVKPNLELNLKLNLEPNMTMCGYQKAEI